MYRFAFVLALALASEASATILASDDFAAFRATGLAPHATDGRLDSQRWRVEGVSDGDTAFGATRAGGDYGRGRADAPVRAGGIYAFVLPDGAVGLGLQPTSSDFNPGALVMRAENGGGQGLEDLTLAFDLWVRDDGSRATRVFVEAAVGDAPELWFPVPGLDLLTGAGPSPTPQWQSRRLEATLPIAGLAPGATVHVRWGFEDGAGTGSRDELALSALRLSATPELTALPTPGTLPLLTGALGLAGAVGRRRAAKAR